MRAVSSEASVFCLALASTTISCCLIASGESAALKGRSLSRLDGDSLDVLGRIGQSADLERVATRSGFEQEGSVGVGESADLVHRGVGRDQQDVGEADGLARVGAYDLALDLTGDSRVRH